VQVREAVLAGAQWFIHSHEELLQHLKRNQVAMIGSGAWACAAARLIAQNTQLGDFQDEFTSEIKMWVHQEDVEV
jgi:glycerol-3-phosphate dehydrogenase (NAD+)